MKAPSFAPFLLLALSFLARVRYGQACTCDSDNDPQIECNAVGALVVYGTALTEPAAPCDQPAPSSPTPTGSSFDEEIVQRLRVDCVLKKPKDFAIAVGDIVNVRSNADEGLCGRTLKVGSQYIIDGGREGVPACEGETADSPIAVFETHLCDATVSNPDEEKLAAVAGKCGAVCKGGGGGKSPPVPPVDKCERKCKRKCANACEHWCSADKPRGKRPWG